MSNSPIPPDLRPALEAALIALRKARTKIEELQHEKAAPIAVVGLGCRFPGGASDPEAFFEMLVKGVDAVSEVPADRWNIDAFFDADPATPGKMSSRWGAFLPDVAGFDARFFGISPREANALDPQQRLLLEVTWEALESGGHVPSTLKERPVGVYIGINTNDYSTTAVREGQWDKLDFYGATGNSLSVAAGRISYHLGVHGPCVALDTACSSSLVAVHFAIQALRLRECDLAIAGGVNVILAPETSVAISNGRAFAPDGRCKTFDAAADGYVRGEGCGVIVLKRLFDAVRDGDHIHAVLLGSGVNHDGKSSGLTVPSGPAQARLIRQVLSSAGVLPDEVSYIEAHGTGTALGDPIEARALGEVFGPGRSADNPLWVGSVKTNLGHLEAGAGIAGLIKEILMIERGVIVPHLHFKTPSPMIDWTSAPFKVPTAATPWIGPRVAGVSAFGIGGTNAHVLVGEAPPRTPAPAQDGPYLLPFSAPTSEALAALLAVYGERLRGYACPRIQDLVHTAGRRRSLHAQRAALVVATVEEVRDRLATLVPQPGAPARARVTQIALLLPDRHDLVGLARVLVARYTRFAALAENLARDFASAGHAGAPAWASGGLGASEGAFVLLAMASWLRECGVRPSIFVGGGAGEIIAAVLAGALTVRDAARAIHTLVALGSRPAAEQITAALNAQVGGLGVRAPGWTLLSSRADGVLTESTLTSAHFGKSLAEQPIFGPVTVEAVKVGANILLCLGSIPKGVDRLLARAGLVAEVFSVGTSEEAWLQLLGALYERQVDLAFEAFTPGGSPAELPIAPWNNERYWTDYPLPSPAPRGLPGSAPVAAEDEIVLHVRGVRIAISDLGRATPLRIESTPLVASPPAVTALPLAAAPSVASAPGAPAAAKSPAGPPAKKTLFAGLAKLTDEALEKDLSRLLGAESARALGLPPNRLDLDTPIFQLGMNSLMIFEVRNWSKMSLEVTLPMDAFSQDVTVRDLVLAAKARILEAARAGAGAKPQIASLPEPARAAPPAPTRAAAPTPGAAPPAAAPPPAAIDAPPANSATAPASGPAMMPSADLARWIVSFAPRPSAPFRIYCFHFAGGAAGTYRSFPALFPAEIDVRAVQLPGRESRFKDTMFTRIGPLVRSLADAIESELDAPYAFFGHSMGCLVLYELTRELRRRGRRLPVHLFVSGSRAPHTPDPMMPLHRLSDADFVEAIRRMGGTPETVLGDQDMMRMFLPILRSDFTVLETYMHSAEPSFEMPISAFCGEDDPRVARELVVEWRKETVGLFESTLFPGGHFYHQKEPEQTQLVQAILRQIAPHIGRS